MRYIQKKYCLAPRYAEYLLLALELSIFGLIVVFYFSKTQNSSAASNLKAIFQTNGLERIELYLGDQTMTFLRDTADPLGNDSTMDTFNWKVESGQRVNPQAFLRLWTELSQTRIESQYRPKPNSSSFYGLNRPQATAIIKTHHGQHKLTVGARNEYLQLYYLQIDSDPTVFLASVPFLQYAEISKSALIEKLVIPDLANSQMLD